MTSDFDYLRDFGRKLEYKLIEILDSYILNTNSTGNDDEDPSQINDVWSEVSRHFALKKSLISKFEGRDIYIEKVNYSVEHKSRR